VLGSKVSLGIAAGAGTIDLASYRLPDDSAVKLGFNVEFRRI
jgi:hypothetical protein